MNVKLPPRRQRLISAKLGRDWFDVATEQLKQGNTQEDIVKYFQDQAQVTISVPTLSVWLAKERRLRSSEKQEAKGRGKKAAA